MADYTRQVKNAMLAEGCYFVRYGKGDHEGLRERVFSHERSLCYELIPLL